MWLSVSVCLCVPCPSVHTSVLCVGDGGGQQEEALIFSETSGSDLATRKRSRPPPRRIRSTALVRSTEEEVEGETQESSYMKLSRDSEDNGASLSGPRSNQSKQSILLRG